MREVFSRTEIPQEDPLSLLSRYVDIAPHRIIGEVIDEMNLPRKNCRYSTSRMCGVAYFYFTLTWERLPRKGSGIGHRDEEGRLPDRVIFTYQGDGDIAAIGTAETIHAARSRREFLHDFC